MRNEVNEIKISYCEKLGIIDSKPLKTPNEVAELLYQNWDMGTIGLHETFKVLLFNQGNKVKGVYQASSGGLTGTLVDLRLLFAVVLKSVSTSIVISHNHPSGNDRPSEADKKLTRRIKKAAELFDITVLDHLIILPNGNYFSFSENGLL